MRNPRNGDACLNLTGLLVGTANNLDFVCFQYALVVEFEVDVFD